MTGKEGEDPDPSDPRSIFGLTEGIHLGKDAFNVREHVAKALQEMAGAIANITPLTGCGPPGCLVVGTDVTIEAPNRDYLYHRIEIKSPPYYFSPEAVIEVREVCQVLSNNYRISCNRSCALHVHVGNGDDGFPVKVISRF